MILTCYYCNKDMPSNQMKRCSRCLLVTYCSKECQTRSWKASHKFNCKVHPSFSAELEPPEKHTPEWEELQVDRALSRWLQLWRSSFLTWTAIALDLTNYQADRVMTHCMQLIIQPRHFEDDPAKQYHIIDAAIVAISDVQAAHPDLEVVVDPTDFTRMRFVVILQNHEGEPLRLRLIQWNDPNIGRWRNMAKERSIAIEGLDATWAEILIDTVNTMDPKDVDQKLGKKRS